MEESESRRHSALSFSVEKGNEASPCEPHVLTLCEVNVPKSTIPLERVVIKNTMSRPANGILHMEGRDKRTMSYSSILVVAVQKKSLARVKRMSDSKSTIPLKRGILKIP
jgi:hypothetical protein